jgi:HEAT repeat protein
MRCRLAPRLLLPLLPLLLAVGAAAGPQGEGKGAVAETAPRDEPRARRVLHLAGGGLLRGASELHAGTWRVRAEGAWLELEERQVLRWRTEAELLRQARGLARDLEGATDGRRVTLARWMATEGLVEEALDELDRVLEAHPDAPEALELLASGRLGRWRGGASESTGEERARTLCAAGAASSRARREQAILALGSVGDEEGGRAAVEARLELELSSARAARRGFAAHALRRLAPGTELEALLRRCALDPSEAVRREAALGLGAAGDDGAVLPLVRALGSPSRIVRTHAAESLGHAGVAGAVPALVAHLANLPAGQGGGSPPVTAHLQVGRHLAYLADFDVELAQGASIADPAVRSATEGVVLDARVGGISGYTVVREQRAVVAALERLTGARPGSSREDWRSWYAEHRGRYERGAGSGSPGPGRGASREPARAPERDSAGRVR